MKDNNVLSLYSKEGKEIEKIQLDPDVFDGKINRAVIYQTVCMYLANQRKGTASTKTRGEVSGGGRKPWRQKGTGRARHGSIRSPLWRKGGVVFGPHPRDFHYTLPHKIKIQALKSVLNARLKENNLKVIEDITLDKAKTKKILDLLTRLDLYKTETKPKKILLLADKDKMDENLKKASHNLKFLELGLVKDLNALQVLRSKVVVFTKSALKEVVERLKKNI
ncbi:MAG: 50S ribosomal protein L4 [Candidatus Omnitrophica bacterium]|nr:50S ribosomal protein L4 [Candidatus Omnitrophota bacterium]